MYRLPVLGFESVTQGDNVFRDLVLARIIEPTSKFDAGLSLPGDPAGRVPQRSGVDRVSGVATAPRRRAVTCGDAWQAVSRGTLYDICAVTGGRGSHDCLPLVRAREDAIGDVLLGRRSKGTEGSRVFRTPVR